MKHLIAILFLPLMVFSQFCPALGPDQYLPCGVNSTTLTANLSQCAAGSNPNQTTNYNVTTIPFVNPNNNGTQITQFFAFNFLNMDDGVSNAIPLPFNFCFFGTSYNQIWVGSNGWVSFTANQPNNFTSSSIPSVAANVPKNCIMGPWQDWHPGLGGQVRYQVQGVAPCRKFVVSWINVPMFSCTSTLGTFHIVLYESTNVIENHIQSKLFCGWAGGTSVQGLHNLAGNTAVAVPGRNSTVWTAQNDARRYTPSGPVVLPTLTWYQVGNPIPIATGVNQITVTPPLGGANYTCHLEYPACNAGWATCNAGGGLGPDTVFVSPGPPNLPAPNLVLQDPHCNNGCDGVITVIPNGGTGVTTISWNGGNSNFTLNNLCSGTYNFNLIDAAGCTYTGVATLLNPAPLTAPLFANIDPTCFGYCDGTSTVNPTGGSAPYTYIWGNGQTNQTVTNLCSGLQTVTVYDQYNCPAVGTTTLLDPPMVTINPISGLDTICYNSVSNLYSVTSNFPNLGYVWTTLIGSITTGQGTNQINLDVSGVNGGTYVNSLSVIGVNQVGCQSQPQTFTITDLNILPVIDSLGPFCEYDNCVNLSAAPSGGLFSGMNVVGSQYCPNNGFIGTDIINYTYNQSGCMFDTTLNVIVYGRPTLLPVVNGVVGENQQYHQICEGDTITDFFGAVSQNSGFNEWYVFGETIQQESINITWDHDGIFQFEVVRWENGCVSNPQNFVVSLELCPNEIFYIPNAFTPDGDEKNNIFKPIITSGVDIYNYNFTVYNRWGELIWESNDPSMGWDGTYNNSLCQVGVYTWKLHFKSPKIDDVKEFYGSLTLIR